MELCVRFFGGWASSCLGPRGMICQVGGRRCAPALRLCAAVNSIVVEGNRRVEADTIRSYFKPGPTAGSTPSIDDGLQGALCDRAVPGRADQPGGRTPGRDGGRKSGHQPGRLRGQPQGQGRAAQLEIQSKPRGTFSRAVVQSDVQRIVDVYRRSGRYDVRVEPKVIELPNNRVDLVFEITEGAKTGVKKINFIGNRAYSSYRLKDVIKTGETSLLAFLQSTNIYDPDRVEADRDLLRRFYLKNGYIDVRIVSAVGEYDPAQRASSSPSRSTRASSTGSAPSTCAPTLAALDPGSLRSRLRTLSRRRLQRRGGREDRRGHDDRGRQARLSRSRSCGRAATAIRRTRTRQSRLHDR